MNNKALLSVDMDLKTYLRENNTDAAAFAIRVRVTKEAVRLWISGGRTPRPIIMRRIVDETNGAVTPNDFLPSGSEVAA
jgi:hypothetical protein